MADLTTRRFRTIDVVMALVALAIVVIFILAGVFIYIEKSGQNAALLDAENRIASLKNMGVPVDLQAFQSQSTSPTNATQSADWLGVLQEIRSKEFTAQSAGIYGMVGSVKAPSTAAEYEHQLQLKQNLVNHYQPLLQQIHTLASRAKPRQIVQIQTTDRISRFREISRILSCETSVLVAQKNSAATLQSLESQISLATVLQGNDSVLNHLVINAIHGATIKNIRLVMQANVLNERDIEKLIQDLQNVPLSVDNWRQIVQWERAQYLPRLRDNSAPAQSTDSEVFHPANGKDLLNFLVYMERYEHVNWSDWKSASEDLSTIDQDLERNVASTTYWDHRNWRATSAVIPPLSHFAQNLVQARSERNQAILLCAIQLYRIRHGAYPDRLDQLANVGIDSAKYMSIADLPFGYEVRENTAYLWGSVRGNDFNFPFEVSPTIPVGPSVDRDDIEQALWTLPP